jgi:hypothetical protein
MTDDFFDAHLTNALTAVPGELTSAADILATIRTRKQRKAHRGMALVAVAAAVVAVIGGTGLALASAAGLFRTVPTHIHITQPGGGGPQPVIGNRVAHPYTTSLQHAEAIAGYPLLTLDTGTVELVTVVPPTTRADGQPISPTEVLKPSFQIDYVVNGTSVQLVEDPVTPGSSLQLNVKGYGAPDTHQATVDGYRVIWQGTDEDSVDTVAFQTTSGTLVYMTSGPGATPGPGPGIGKELSLRGYVELMQGMS